MKTPTHNEIESWRHDDVNLRWAVEQQNKQLPSLPEGFEERMMMKLNNLATPAEAQPAPAGSSHNSRRLWPFAAALSAAAMLAVAYIIFSPKETAQIAEAPVIAPAGVLPEDEGAIAPEALATNTLTTKGDDILAEKKKAKQTEDKMTSTARAALSSEAVIEEVEKDGVAIDDVEGKTEASTPDSTSSQFTIDLNRLNHLVAEATGSGQAAKKDYKYNNVRASEGASRVTLSVNIGADGGLLANVSDNGIETRNARNDYQNSNLADNYYLPIGNGYSYDNNSAVMVKQWRYSDVSYTSSKYASNSTTSHKLPVVVGMNLSIPITKKWCAETGLSYTKLSSTTDNYANGQYIHESQRIHYLGIPLRAQFRFLDSRFFTAYTTAGGSIEIPVKAALESRSQVWNESSTTTTSLSAPVQFSTTLSLGAQFNCNSLFGIFAEPQLQWFVPTGSDIETYRTKHPLRFVPAVGLRWTL
ncbi:MAG: PorT family protein [Bacteroidaceae bacterium]|nr:PorT family protein [Bacteroidaceae bacterium]